MACDDELEKIAEIRNDQSFFDKMVNVWASVRRQVRLNWTVDGTKNKSHLRTNELDVFREYCVRSHFRLIFSYTPNSCPFSVGRLRQWARRLGFVNKLFLINQRWQATAATVQIHTSIEKLKANRRHRWTLAPIWAEHKSFWSLRRQFRSTAVSTRARAAVSGKRQRFVDLPQLLFFSFELLSFSR